MRAHPLPAKHPLPTPLSRVGGAPPSASRVLIPKALADYGKTIAELLALDVDLLRLFTELDRLEGQLRENGCTPPRPDLSGRLRAAWSHHRGEGFWERP